MKVWVDKTKCKSEPTCKAADRCPFSALNHEPNQAPTVKDRCIGCGYCLEHCPHGALSVGEDY